MDLSIKRKRSRSRVEKRILFMTQGDDNVGRNYLIGYIIK